MALETYGEYQLIKKLATGGMAQIFLARQEGLEGFEKLLVVKRILPHLAENDDFIKMFLDEARIAARLNHPNIVQIFNLGAIDDSFFIAMEYIHGDDVRRIWKRADAAGTPMPVPLVLRVIMETALGLDYAHKKTDPSGKPLGIVHRDVSPQNILVTFEGAVKMVDFGIAKAADQATVTRSGVLKGKYSYMSPEQAAGKKIDHRTDIFALGVVLYELLTQTRLFKRANDIQTLNAVTECEVVAPSEVNADLPPSLDDVVLKALAKDPAERYQHAVELQEALEDWLISNQLSSSSVELAKFMQTLYADRLLREAEEGRVLVDELDSSRNQPEVKGTPAPVESKGERKGERKSPNELPTASMHQLKPGPPVPEEPPAEYERAPPPIEADRTYIDPPRDRPGPPVPTPAPRPRITSERERPTAGMPLEEQGEERDFDDDEGESSAPKPEPTVVRDRTAEKEPTAESVSTQLPAPSRERRRSLEQQRAVSQEREKVTAGKSVSRSVPTITALDAAKVPWRAVVGGLLLLAAVVSAGVFAVRPRLERVHIESEPPGASVWFQGQLVPGLQTPCDLPRAKAGSYRLELRLPGYQPFETTVFYPQVGELTFHLEPARAEPPPVPDAGAVAAPKVTLTVSSTPAGAELSVDGEASGKTPASVEVRGHSEVTVKLVAPGYKELEERVAIDEQPLEKSFTLQRARNAPARREMGKVRFVVKPWAYVTCGDANLGATPFGERSLPVGKLRCTFSNPSYPQKIVQTVEVSASETAKVTVNFDAKP